MTVIIDGVEQLPAGTVGGDLIITGDLTVQGTTTSTVNQTISGTVIIDVDNAEALLVRKDGDAEDVLIVDTNNSRVGFRVSNPTSVIHGNATLDAGAGNEIAFELDYTVNKAGGNDTGLLINKTDTASSGTSLVVDLQVDASTVFSVDNIGGVIVGGATPAAAVHLLLPQENDATTPTLAFGDGDMGFYESSDDVLRLSMGGFLQWEWTTTYFGGPGSFGARLFDRVATDIVATVAPHSSDDNTGIGRVADDQLSLIAGGIEGIRITEAASSITIDFDAGDNATGNVGSVTTVTSAIATISSSAAATLTASNLIPAGVHLIGLTARITTGFGTSTGLTDFDVGDGTDVNRWADSLAITAGTTMDLTDQTNSTASGDFAAANDVVLTAVGGNFDATGVIELIAHYITLTAPTG